MFGCGKIYTVHEKPDAAEPTERMVLVREGFSFWAFLFNGFWLLANRCWIPFAYYLLLSAALVYATGQLGMSEITSGVLQFALQVLLGFSGHDIQRWQLARRGYEMQGVVVAPSELLATQRAYDQHLAA